MRQPSRGWPGPRPDAASLAALSAWAGLNPSDFVDAPYKPAHPEPMAQDLDTPKYRPYLDIEESAEAVEAIVRAAYERIRKPERSDRPLISFHS